MATEKKSVKVDFNRGVVADAIAKDVKSQIDNAKNTVAVYRGYVKLVSDGHMTVDHAKPLLVAFNAKLAAARKANNDPRPVAPLQDSRVSEMKSILRLADWKCWPKVFDMLDGMDVNKETLNTVSKFVRSKVKGEMKANVNAAPKRDAIMRAIKARKKARRGTDNGGRITVKKPETNIDMIAKHAKGLKTWFKGESGSQFIAAILKAVASVKPIALKVAKERAAAEEATA